MPFDLSGVRVLIVDDSATSREIMTKLTASVGMRPSEAEGGVFALDLLFRELDKNDPFQIAIIDMQMPEMNGEQLGRAILSDPRLARMPSILLTSLSDRRDWEKNGFAGCVNKPIRRDDLVNALSTVLENRAGSGLQPATKPEAAPAVLQPFAGLQARILLVEDNFVNQMVAVGILKKFGLTADIANNGVEALKALASTAYALVLMDMRMPVMDGVEATRQIRKSDSSVLDHSLPIIAMTANAMQADRDLCRDAGMNDFVSKPVDAPVLMKTLQNWLLPAR
jgi:CheY-like chemotaxis protein